MEVTRYLALKRQAVQSPPQQGRSPTRFPIVFQGADVPRSVDARSWISLGGEPLELKAWLLKGRNLGRFLVHPPQNVYSSVQTDGSKCSIAHS